MILEEDSEDTVVEVFNSAASMPPEGNIQYCITLWERIKGIRAMLNSFLDYVTNSVLTAKLKKLENELKARIDQVVEKVEGTEERLEEFIEDVLTRRDRDIQAFADQSERSDYASNLLKANCVLITGMSQIVVNGMLELVTLF